MNWKIVLFALPITALALAGCGGDDCTTAAAHLASCALPTTSASTGMMMTDMACAGVAQCQAECENKYSCTQINGNDPNFTACMNLCKGK